ncbi:MAG: DUF5009 domain-containing protein [Flavobacteriales bacterium]|nr:DUF5009 domain-containing protein [Flavobacteriales bacterium]
MKSNRLMSLDALRGFDMFFIMGLSGFITALCALCPGDVSEAIAQSMKHVAWDGLHHHDTIFPLFLFLAGVSFPFSYASQREKGASTKSIVIKIVRRAVILVFLGMIYNGLLKFNFDNMRYASVLARIGIAWMVAALLYVNFGIKMRAVICVVILLGYALLTKYVAAPDVINASPLSLEGNIVGYIDRLFLPDRLLYNNHFDPEGLLSALPAVVTAMLGIFTGELIRLPQNRLSGNRKALYMLATAVALAIVAVIGKNYVPINKMLWSSTFVCAVGAYSLVMMAVFYYVIDVRGYKRWTLVLRVVGMNSITIYLAQRIIGFKGIANFFVGGVANALPEDWAALVLQGGYMVVCWLFLYFLYRKNTFLKV